MYNLIICWFFLAAPRGLQDPSSPTRDWTWTLSVKAPSPNPWATKELLMIWYTYALWNNHHNQAN